MWGRLCVTLLVIVKWVLVVIECVCLVVVISVVLGGWVVRFVIFVVVVGWGLLEWCDIV